MTSSPVKTDVLNVINNSDYDDGIPVSVNKLLPFIPVSDFKSFLCQKIEEADEEKLLQMKLACVSMNDILPIDIIGHMISFAHLFEMIQFKTVCKTWNVLGKQCEKNFYSRLIQKLGKDFTCNKIWIKNSKQNKLTKSQEELNYLLFKKEQDVFKYICSNDVSGDVFLLFADEYKINFQPNLLRDVAIIGIPLRNAEPRIYFDLSFDLNVCMEINCKLIINSLWICLYAESDGFNVNENASLLMNDCFVMNWARKSTTINVAMNAKIVTIRNCVFKNFKHCIKLIPNEEKINVQLCCLHTEFMVKSNAIVEEIQGKKSIYIGQKKLYKLEGNTENEIKICD